jgi:hypothetical protein
MTVRSPLSVLVLGAAVLGSITACAGSSPAATATTAVVPTAAAAGTSAPSAAAATVPSTAAAASAPGGPLKPTVDLTFSGTVPLVVSGQVGTCQLGKNSNGVVTVLGYNATEADFPGFGDNFNITENPPTNSIGVKWAIRQGLAFFGYFEAGAVVAPDHKSITLDADMPPSGALTEHVKGTIVCP